MAFIHFDPSYAPCGFLVVRDGASPYSDTPGDTVLVQSDWDFPRVAMSCSWGPASKQAPNRRASCYGLCGHSGTDGTVRCEVCGLLPSEIISSAYDYLREHDGECFPELDDYLTTE